MNPQTRRLLEHIGSFNVKLCGPNDIVNGLESLPAHEYVLSPILKFASECKVYGIKKNSNLFEYVRPIISDYRKGGIFLDLTKEVVKGYERLWNADLFERSSIVITTAYDIKTMKKVFAYCGKPQIWASHYMLNMGQSKAAISYSRSLARNKEIVILLAHEMEYIDVFASRRQLLKLFKISWLQGKSSFKIAPIPKCHIHPKIITLADNAIYDNDFNKVKALVEQNPDLIKVKVFELRRQATTLHRAARLGRVEIAEYLISKDANVNATDREGMTPLHSALCRKDNIAELLINKGADVHAVDSLGYTPMHYACNYKLKESVGLLLTHGAKINAQDKKGYTPLDYVLRINDEVSQAMAEFLRRNGGKSWSDLKK